MDSSKTEVGSSSRAKNNVISLPTKKNAEDIGQFIANYAEAVATVGPDKRPKNVIIMEMYEVNDDDTSYFYYIGGPSMRMHETLGCLEVVKTVLLSSHGEVQ